MRNGSLLNSKQEFFPVVKIQYPKQGTVSIWIGTFLNENGMDRCVDGLIEPSLKLPTPLSAICEVAYEANPMSVRPLLEGFSGWETFVDEACAAAAQIGITEANGALVCYNLLCEATSKQWPGIVFLGSFSGRDVP